MKKTGKQNIRWNTMKILAVGFLSVIFLGAVLLWLPVSNEKSISFLDALFTSTSSVCVTGLVTIVPKYQFTITGKVILLILIQIGGLGVIACITAFFMLLKRKITVKERVVIQEAYNMDSLGGRTMGLQKESGMEFFIQFLHFATQELTSLEMTVWQDTQQIL